MSRIQFVCSSCGYESQKWLGRCPECASWNTFEEVKVEGKKAAFISGKSITLAKPQKISEIKSVGGRRLSTGFEEFDRVLGGTNEKRGIVPGSAILLAGDPGIGKSTLLLQLALNLARNSASQKARGPVRGFPPASAPSTSSQMRAVGSPSTSATPRSVLYITGEESESQVKMRAERVLFADGASESSLLILSTTDIDNALSAVLEEKPALVIVDSIQTMVSESLPGFPGSIPQLRYAASRLISLAKQTQVGIFLIGHVTKEGIVAGPMILSHMVDALLYLEGETLTGTRILRAYKNRFGDTSEVGIFIMEEKGLSEIKDAGEFFMNKRDLKVPGSCIAVIMEGSRPILVEIQALAVPSTLSFPRRVSTGIQGARLELLLAVLQKHLRLPLDRMDIFVNVVGGLKVAETAPDLAVCLAIISSFKNKYLSALVAIAEIGLLGELKSVVNLDTRIKEAKKFHFSSIISVKNCEFLRDATKVARLQ